MRTVHGALIMRPTYDSDTATFRQTVRDFLRANLPPGWKGIGALGADEAHHFANDVWRPVLAEHGYLAPAWPAEFGGGGLSELEQVILVEEFSKVGAPRGGSNDQFSITYCGNTILNWGTDDQKAEFLPKIISGEYVFCQGYSEPNAGSDLAALSCRAERDGDEWVINGQKVWTSSAHHANWIFVLCRTDTELPRHNAITFFLCPMDQPGVVVRPIPILSGEIEFSETFFTDARTSSRNIIGEVNGGWAVAMALLGFERGAAAATLPIDFRNELDRLIALARQRGATDDALIRQRLARAHCDVEIMRFMGMRTLTGWLKGAKPGPSESVFRVFWGEYHRRVTELAVDIFGADAMHIEGKLPNNAARTDDVGAPNDTGSWVGTFYNARAGTIYGGTAQIQRNVLGEMVLGLPREPRG